MTTSVNELQRVLGQQYRVERELGAGGMATVYLAHDPKHDRRVAIKVLRPELAAIVGGDRFLKEIRTTANLQHPHILPLHDSGEADGTIYYVMPYVEGESLRQLLTREKQLPVEEAVRIAREVASGLDYAHRHGVVHRDIKPENILLHDGQALVADFGIALAFSRSDGGTRMTETGMSLGTPNYMSPEQAMGEREITPRSDVYALGCVLYEMLVGEPPFTGPTPQAVIARVLTDEPRSLTTQRRTIPQHVEAAVHTALSKIPADRFATAAQFSEALVGRTSTTSPPAKPARLPDRNRRGRRYAVLGIIALALLATGAGVGWLVTPPARAGQTPARLSVRISPDHRLTGAPIETVALSPDGASIIYVGESARGMQLYRRRLDELVAVPLTGTEGATFPAFSPDGVWISFLVSGRYRKVPAAGGSAVPAGLPNNVFAALQVGPDDFIVSGDRGVLGRIRNNGAFEVIARPDSSTGESALTPSDVLPDGRVLVIGVTQGITGPIWIIDPKNGKRQLVTRALAGGAAYQDGYVAWVLPTGELVAAPFDERRGEIGGATQVIAPNVRIAPGAPPQVAFSRNGSLIYVPAQPSDLVRLDRAGRAEVIGGQPRRFHSPRVSPDGSRIALDLTDETRDVWLLTLRDSTLTRLTFDSDGHDPTWMPDGRSVLYGTNRANGVGIHRRRIDGTGAADSVLHEGTQLTAHAVTPDGGQLIAARSSERGDFDLVRVRMGKDRRAEPFLATPFNESHPALSPNGTWLAYVSDESGRAEVYLRPLDDASGRIVVSHNGGSEPVWSRNGRELFYRDFEGPSLIAAAIATTPELRVVSRTRLFDASDFESAAPHANYDVTGDGKFIFVRNARVSELILVQNWTELIRRRATGR